MCTHSKHDESNDLLRNISERVSLRRYDDKDISDRHMDIILDSAIKAPTAGNMMMYSILKITDDDLKESLSKTCDNQPFIKKAPVVLVFVADVKKWFDYYKICGEENVKTPQINEFMLSVNDALIACQNAVLAAESLNIGSCYIGDIMENYEQVKSLLNLPKHTFPAAMITLGYYPPTMKRVYRDRFDKEYVVFDNTYKSLDENELRLMFKHKEENMPKTNIYNAENVGQLFYRRKSDSDFSKEMARSINKWMEDFTSNI